MLKTWRKKGVSILLSVSMQCVLRTVSESSKQTCLNIHELKIYLFTANKQNGLKIMNWKEGLTKD